MATASHQKTNNIADWTQTELDAQIALGNFPSGTVLADIVLPSDWNDTLPVTLGTDENFATDAQIAAINALGTASTNATGDFATAAQGAKADTALQPGDIGSTVQAYSTVLDATTAAFTTAQETKLAGIATGATANSSDATLLARANHTGTQTASTISDFDTEVSNNTDVAANTAARHDAVTVLDSAEIDFTLVGQQITASLIAGSIDETKLDTSVNASLDLADSAAQPGDNISSFTNDAGYITATLSQEQVEDYAGALIGTGGTKTRITVTYQDATGTVDFVVDGDLANYSNTNTQFITAAGAPVQSVAGKTGTVTLTSSDVGLGSVTNNAQTQAAIVPNTAPAAGQVLAGNAGGTAYAPVAVSGDATLSSAGALTVTKTNGSNFAASATTDTTNASNISSGTLAAARGGAGTVNGLLKANGTGTVSAAVSGTDYAPATSGTAILKGNAAGGFSSATAGVDYVAPGGALGTPSSGTLTNCTDLTNAGVAAAAGIALNKLAATTGSRALVSDASGFVTAATTTSTEIGYVNGVTSAIQTQLDGKATLASDNAFTSNTNSYSTDGTTQIIIRGKGATGVQNDSAGMQFQKTNDQSNERTIMNRYFGHSSRNDEFWFDNRVAGSTVSSFQLGNGWVNIGSGSLRVGAADVVDSERVFKLRSYTVATVPSASTKGAGATIYVSNGAAGSPVMAFSNATSWLRCDTRAAISAT